MIFRWLKRRRLLSLRVWAEVDTATRYLEPDGRIRVWGEKP